MNKYADETDQLDPPLAYVPWVLINDQPLKELSLSVSLVENAAWSLVRREGNATNSVATLRLNNKMSKPASGSAGTSIYK
ncbi:hypothetical protein Leryth_003520 [Lithospermum erythrorhizon]|nr:hypothetical protein Leryth_003520 [Lithospermum erythrorhizon]